MSRQFTFTNLQSAQDRSNEANIFIHGYSAGHTEEDRKTLISSIPESLQHHTNIFAFWPSSHFTRFSTNSVSALNHSARTSLLLGAATFLGDRALHFRAIRTRAEEMGEALFDELDKHLRLHHQHIDTVNLIGHSLGGRLVVSSLKKRACAASHRLTVNDVLLMAAAVEVADGDVQLIRKAVTGRLINAYSTSDWTLLMNAGESCLGRNPAEHFENIRITDFGHGDYWKKLREVLTHVQFKTTAPEPEPDVEEQVFTAPESTAPPVQEIVPMPLELKTPADIYQRVKDELTRIAESVQAPSTDAKLNKGLEEAREVLSKQQETLQTLLDALEKNAEWQTFTIAVYGETGAGKSTLIETLRILLKEPTKVDHQQAFRTLQSQYLLSEANLQSLQQTMEQTDAQLAELAQQLHATTEHHDQLHSDALNAVVGLRALIAERKETATLWQKLIRLFKPLPELAQLALAEQQLPVIVAARESAVEPLRAQHGEIEVGKHELTQQLTQLTQESQGHLKMLDAQADGKIIGDGRADFTRHTQRYDMTLNGQSFALLDVPGIEGNEGLVVSQIDKAVQTAHAVLYVTNQAAPPQTGDEHHKGTLEKIKDHLGAQTEVWTIFNKKITNPKHSLADRKLVSDDEIAGLQGLNEKMREQLGEHYRDVVSLSALPAFLASTDHFAPNSDNASRRSRMLATFDAEELLEKTQLRAFLYLLNSKVLDGSEGKITRANFHKAKDALDQTIAVLDGLKDNVSNLLEDLSLAGKSAKVQLTGSFKSLKKRLEASGGTEIELFLSKLRDAMYKRIDAGIGNDELQQAFINTVELQEKKLSTRISAAIAPEIERFQNDAKDILSSFEAQARELTSLYATLGNTKLAGKFDLKINIESGIKVAPLLMGLAGTIAGVVFSGGASLLLLAPALAGLALSALKAVRGWIDSDYKKAQQRAAIETNLRQGEDQLSSAFRDGLKTAFADMQKKIRLLEQAIDAPIKQTSDLVQLLSQSTEQLKLLSRQIDNAGTL
ncbi:DUF726 domain-containing protein [Pseudomonas sp. GV071]|uniref:DUF726 domain-containing protein n=1 Tax=Pseudomonas sp. GV071 TaxID=2135754 RepID=UPI000D3A1ABA|nr:DUF726 domain-containing protein [Pseudomonas sp. GV071]PTQ70304.1 uncharacterized protein DUF726 [Pseudomonas sp. GV071]